MFLMSEKTARFINRKIFLKIVKNIVYPELIKVFLSLPTKRQSMYNSVYDIMI